MVSIQPTLSLTLFKKKISVFIFLIFNQMDSFIWSEKPNQIEIKMKNKTPLPHAT